MSSLNALTAGVTALGRGLDLGGASILDAALAAAGGSAAGSAARGAASKAGSGTIVLAPRTSATAAKGKVATAVVKKKAASTKPASTSKATATKAATSGPYAFLSDPTLSVEDKLLRFMLQVQKETDADLQRRMEALAGKGSASGAGSTPGSTATSGAGGSSSGTSRGVSVWSIAKAIVPALGLGSAVVGDAALKKLVQQVSGPMLAAAATAIGLPALAPVATKLGSSLGDLLTSGTASPSALASVGLGALGGSSAASSPGGSSATGGGASAGSSTSAEDKQQELMLLQHAMDKQKEMTSMVSNLLKSMHDGRMNVISNLR
jgi:hypothetical protein